MKKIYIFTLLLFFILLSNSTFSIHEVNDYKLAYFINPYNFSKNLEYKFNEKFIFSQIENLKNEKIQKQMNTNSFDLNEKIMLKINQEFFSQPSDTITTIVEVIDNNKFSLELSQLNIKTMKKFSLGNFYTLTISKSDINKLASFNSVKRIWNNKIYKPFIDVSVPLIGADNIWKNLNYNGKGIRVCIVDTGINKTHPALNSKVINETDIVINDWDGNDPMDYNGHGTHVAGIIASNSSVYKGVAPGVDLLNAKVFFYIPNYNTWFAYEKDILTGIDWCINQNANIITLSLGGEVYPDDGSDPLSQYLDLVVDQGITVTVAVGNDGPKNILLSSPGVAHKVITVGSTKTNKAGITDSISEFSSRGPTYDYRIKPDVTAPGEIITSTNSTGGWISLSGTSMATPHVAGLAALILEANNSLTPEQIKVLIMNSANDLGENLKDNIYGAGRINATKLFNEINYTVKGFINASQFNYHEINVSSNASELRITLYWPENYLIHNDLDLFLIDPNGNITSSSTSFYNTDEMIKILNPQPGTWKALISTFVLNETQKYTIASNFEISEQKNYTNNNIYNKYEGNISQNEYASYHYINVTDQKNIKIILQTNQNLDIKLISPSGYIFKSYNNLIVVPPEYIVAGTWKLKIKKENISNNLEINYSIITTDDLKFLNKIDKILTINVTTNNFCPDNNSFRAYIINTDVIFNCTNNFTIFGGLEISGPYNLDMNNSIISGDNSDIGIKILNNNITIKKGIVKNYEKGIISNKGDRVIISNLSIYNNYVGLEILFSTNNTISNLSFFNNSFGMLLFNSTNNTISNVSISNNYVGLEILFSTNNSILNSSISNCYYDLFLYTDNSEDCNNVIENITGSNNKPIKYIRMSENIQNQIFSELILCNASNSNINNISIIGNNNNGLIILFTNNSNFSNIIYNNINEIYFIYSNNNLIANNTFHSEFKESKIYQIDSENNTFINHKIITYFSNTIFSFISKGNIILSGVNYDFPENPSKYLDLGKFLKIYSEPYNDNQWIFINISYYDIHDEINESNLILGKYNYFSDLELNTSKFAKTYGINFENKYLFANITEFSGYDIVTLLGNPLQQNITFTNYPNAIEVYRGQNYQTKIRAKNNGNYSVNNVNIWVLGIDKNWWIQPESQNISINEEKEFILTFIIPNSASLGEYPIIFKINKTFYNTSVKSVLKIIEPPNIIYIGGQSGGGGGGEISGAIISEIIKDITSELFDDRKIVISASVGESYKFLFLNEYHTIKVLEQKENYVKLLISSTPKNITLYVNESRSLDLNGDGIDDIEIKLLSIYGSKINLIISLIENKITKDENKTSLPEEKKPIEKKVDTNLFLELLIVGIMILLVVIFSLFYLKNKKHLNNYLQQNTIHDKKINSPSNKRKYKKKNGKNI